jgi:hypothetical protein
MRRALLVCAAITFAIACTDNITEPTPDRSPATVGTTASRAGTVAFATTTTEDGLSISTDKDDYQPGDVVHLTGYGWPANDVLDIVLTDDPLTHDPHRWSVNVGEDGTFQDDTYIVDEGDLNVTFTLTATTTLATPARSLTVEFTDGNLQALLLNPTTRSVVPGGTVQYAVNGQMGGNNEACTINLAVLTTAPTLPAGASASFSANNFNTTNQDFSKTLAIATTSTTAPGTYPFTVRATEGDDCNSPGGTADASGTLTVSAPNNQPPVVTLNATYSGNEGDAISLTNAAASDPENQPLTITWSYTPDPANTETQDCVITPSDAIPASIECKDNGAGTIRLSVSDGNSITEKTATLTVANVNPTATAGGGDAGYVGDEGSPIQLNGSGDDQGDNDDPVLTYAWTVNTTGIDAGGTCTFDDATKKDATITCTDDSGAGTFTVSLVVSDDDGGTSAASSANLKVNNVKPVANAGGPYGGNEGSVISLSGTGDDQGNNDGDPKLTYLWTVDATGIDAGGTCTLVDANTKTAKVTCTDNGSFKVKLVAKDDDNGTSTESAADLNVGNVNPVAQAGGPYGGKEGEDIPLDGSATDVGTNDTFTWVWEYTSGPGDLDPNASCAFSSATAQKPTIKCTDDGTVKLTLTVTDDNGGSSADDATLTLTNVDPVADAGGTGTGPTGTYSGNEGSAVQLYGSATDAGTNDQFTWSWVYIAGSGALDEGATCTFDNANAQQPKITCTDDGTVKLTLTVADDDGGSDTDDATLTLANLAPVAAAGGPYTVAEGTARPLAGSANDPGDNDDPQLTYKWTYAAGVDVDAGATCSFAPNDLAQSPSVTCTDDGTFTLSLVAKDDDGGTSVASTANFTVTNADPIATPGGPYTGAEGQAIQLSGSGDDPGNNDDLGLTYLWTSNAPSTCTFDAATSKTAKVTCNDDGNFTLTLTVKDDDGGTGTNTTSLTVTNAAPDITTLTVSPTVVQVGAPVTLNATFTDQGTGDTHTASINWEGTITSGTVTETNGSGSVTGTHSYAATGIYTVTLTVTDDEGDSDTEAFPQYIVVYDPSAGFVTGGGWINSQAGAYRLDQTLTGKANFGFVSKYQKGANTPTGNTEFQFHAGSLNFSSTVYEWLVVQGQTKATYKGSGTVNGASGYGFLLSVIDNGSSGDRFRMKIWNKTTGGVVYDNQYGADDEASAAQYTAGGSIVIHTNGGVASK